MEYSPEKFLNAILFFAHNVSKLGITKLNKLLYYSDFEHYRLYGRPILGDQYIRMERGPVPQASYAVFNANFEDSEDSSLKEAIEVRGENFFSRQFNNAYERKSIIPKREADLSYFSKSEIETMEKVAKNWIDATAHSMSEQSHREKPWKETKHQQVIDYKLILSGGDSISKEYAEYREESDRALEGVLHG